MHCQVYDDEDEFEPRITPKPMTKPDGFAVPSVPEISLIFDKPIITQNRNDQNCHGYNLSPAKSERPVIFDNPTVNTKSISPNLNKRSSYTAWKEQNFSRKKDLTDTMHVSPLCKNTYHVSQLPISQSYIPQSHVPRPYVPDLCISQSHVPQLHTRQSHAPQSHASQSCIPQLHAAQLHAPQSPAPWSDVPQYALQSRLQDIPVQNQQKQNKISNSQNKPTNARSNDEIYEKTVKFRCPNTDASYSVEQEIRSSPSDKRYTSYNSLQRTACNVTNHTARTPNNTVINGPKQNEHLQMPHMGYPYPCQQFYAPGYPNHDVENKKTVKTLLQLISSQSEQIKTLQSQVDRLVRLQEESFRNRSMCTCSLSPVNRMFGYQSINSNETTNAFNSSQGQSHNPAIKKAVDQNTSITEKKDVESSGKNKNDNTLDVMLEQQSKKAFMEQKVSIGVMTSFEFTVQNNPFMDSEIHEKKETQGENSNINTRSIGNIQDTTETIKKYKNTFTCKPGAVQLENIVEDTESYLSSSQQQSSNFNANSSMRDSERNIPRQSDLHNISNTIESSKASQHPTRDLNQKEIHKEIYIRNKSNLNNQEQNMRRMWNTSLDIAGNPIESAKCNKALTVNNAKKYTTTNKEKGDDETNADKHNVHLPITNYCQDHNNDPNVKQFKNVGDSMTLSGGDFKVFERPPPTPEPSIHVEMQEYISDDESDKPKHTSKIGWTFYNNVLGQVNEILQNSAVVIDEREENDTKTVEQRKTEQKDDTETRTALNTVKVATLEQLRRLGISITENNEHKESNGNNKTVEFDSSFYPRLDRQANMTHATSVMNETNTSMHMKALALKYLSDEQLADIALHKQGSSLKHFMLSNMQGTNMSFATMRYLERYQLLPGRNNTQIEDIDQIYEVMAPKHDLKPMTEKNNPALHQLPLVRTPATTCPSRILDISTLKRQPKLL